jgi:electron transport complex protein RnfG
MKSVKGGLGDKWYLYPPAAGSREAKENPVVEFCFAVKADKRTGVLLAETQPGKHGPVRFGVAMDLAGKVTGVAVLSMAEKRGKPIAAKRFLGQFNGKTSKSQLIVGKDIDVVSGATISSRAAAFAVKKAILLYETAFRPPPSALSPPQTTGEGK